MLDLAFSVAWFVALVILWIFGESRLGYNAVWRGTLGLGIIPPLILIVARIFMVEPEAYKKNSMRHTKIPYWLIIKRYWVKLLGMSSPCPPNPSHLDHLVHLRLGERLLLHTYSRSPTPSACTRAT